MVRHPRGNNIKNIYCFAGVATPENEVPHWSPLSTSQNIGNTVPKSVKMQFAFHAIPPIPNAFGAWCELCLPGRWKLTVAYYGCEGLLCIPLWPCAKWLPPRPPSTMYALYFVHKKNIAAFFIVESPPIALSHAINRSRHRVCVEGKTPRTEIWIPESFGVTRVRR